ncbi:hypothetical protein GCM10010912_68160 [Paenibacillus albidus]|uniref:Uncharacterized protein n=1 Tax=Paenibacillus albidus TaxID=2041023 RepID=A0A917FYF7_9BACL|nr:hypothetical protein [Paenibacillus albidus]GGG14100.1 hypothetical protein GCM10010912_68160 [Paenibacillus albidus]
MEYSLKVNGQKTDAIWLMNVLEKKNLKAHYLRKYHNSFLVDEFSLSIGLRISIHENNYSPDHPAFSYETMFLEHDFVYQETVSFELDKFCERYELGYKTIYEISFLILESLKTEGLFYHTSGEEIFFYKDGKYIFNGKYLELLKDQYDDLLESLDYSLFDD